VLRTHDVDHCEDMKCSVVYSCDSCLAEFLALIDAVVSHPDCLCFTCGRPLLKREDVLLSLDNA
jgi:hypothetical protein